MKKIFVSFLILLTVVILSSSSTITAYANSAPKPSIKVEVIGLGGEYYLDFLIEGAVNNTYSDEIYSELNAEFLEYADALRTFRDAGSYRYWRLDGNFWPSLAQNLKLTDEATVNFGHIVPINFKIVIIKENKDIIITNQVKRTQFNSNMVLNLTSNLSLVEGETNIYEFTGSVVEVGALREKILGFLLRLFITLAVELLIAIFIFRITKKQALKIILIANIFTQTMLNVVLLNLPTITLTPILDYGPVFFYLEISIICAEMLAYKHLIKGYSTKRLLLYAFVANFVTAILTFMI